MIDPHYYASGGLIQNLDQHQANKWLRRILIHFIDTFGGLNEYDSSNYLHEVFYRCNHF